MSSDMDWSHDFCLSCDNQTTDGTKFCSQACRLADLEKASYGSSSPSTPATHPTSTPSWTLPAPSTPRFHLPPALNFSSVRTTTPDSPPPSKRGLSPSSSRSSLSSISSSTSSTTPGLSDSALTQLREYSGAFDQTRDWLRRRTLG
ncbi:hypothetical protein EJ06DRAFT_522823 [Trichodelitschia bisporula]|uniref:Uncharacterized protein n=1 Tax=Trichodelitschia bisporula TaxID=703511 RepID=A0A6G1HTE4_9PEZI|nr:hypothetical protein EJ06DRAFT_522823 [Trichodelitschia bisporula]